MFNFAVIFTEIMLKMRMAESDCVIIMLEMALQLSYLQHLITFYKMNNM